MSRDEGTFRLDLGHQKKITIQSMQVSHKKRWAGGVIEFAALIAWKWLGYLSNAQTGYELLRKLGGYLVPGMAIGGIALITWDIIEPRLAKSRVDSPNSDLAPSDPMIVPEPGWSYFHWDEVVFQERPLVLRNRGGGDAKSVRVSSMSNRFGSATFREIGFIPSHDSESVTPSVENYDSAPMIKQRDLAHLVDAEFNPIGQREGSIKMSIEYMDVNNNKFITTGRIVREQTNAPHQFKDLKFRRVI